jgi:hypothetical protein
MILAVAIGLNPTNWENYDTEVTQEQHKKSVETFYHLRNKTMKKSDNFIEKTEEHIRKSGLSVVCVSGDEKNPPFAYSVGLQKTYDHPEIICFGMPIKLSHQIINDVAEIIKKDGKIKPNTEYTNIFKDSRAIFLPVKKNNIEGYLYVAIGYYGSNNFEALQLIWTDRNNKFPWEKGFEEEFEFYQPLLNS